MTSELLEMIFLSVALHELYVGEPFSSAEIPENLTRVSLMSIVSASTTFVSLAEPSIVRTYEFLTLSLITATPLGVDIVRLSVN